MKRISVFLCKKINKNIILEFFLVYLFVFLSVSDQLREAMPISGVGMLLYATIRDFLCLCLICYYRNKINVSTFVYFSVFFLLLASVLSIATGLSIVSAIKNFWLYIKFFLIYYIFKAFLSGISEKDFKNFLKILEIFGLCFLIINIIVVLFFRSLMTVLYSDGLRLTIGNSSIISYMYFTFFILADNFKIFEKKITNSFFLVIFIIGIMSTVTTTAFIGLIAYYVLKFVELKIKGKIKILISLIFIIITLTTLFGNIQFTKQSVFTYIIEKSEQIKDLFSGKSLSSVGTLNAREQQKEMLINYMKSYDYILGLGLEGHQRVVLGLENFYRVVLFDFGIIGSILFFTTMLFCLISSFVNNRLILFNLLIVFACYCYTLDFFLPYLTTFCFALLLAIENRVYYDNRISIYEKGKYNSFPRCFISIV